MPVQTNQKWVRDQRSIAEARASQIKAGAEDLRTVAVYLGYSVNMSAWEGPDNPQDVLLQNFGGTEPNRTFTYMMLKATANDRCKLLVPCHNEFRRLRSDTVRQVALETTTTCTHWHNF
ncbi:hypothetical protein TNCV_2752551 [Trichonephila clavipes]|nr:hypothetical protein TNCV_2752551 [Trichonephila clavipes]